MPTPSPSWESSYRSDRRKHSHRCRCCNRIIKDGERVLMIRLRGFRGNKTWALHIVACADQPHTNGWTWRDAFECWGTEHLRRCGYRLPEHPMMLGAAKIVEAG